MGRLSMSRPFVVGPDTDTTARLWQVSSELVGMTPATA
jgi:hypothetical protein